MSDADQTRQDPTEVHEQPDTEGEQLPTPGDERSVTSEMDDGRKGNRHSMEAISPLSAWGSRVSIANRRFGRNCSLARGARQTPCVGCGDWLGLGLS